MFYFHHNSLPSTIDATMKKRCSATHACVHYCQIISDIYFFYANIPCLPNCAATLHYFEIFPIHVKLNSPYNSAHLGGQACREILSKLV